MHAQGKKSCCSLRQPSSNAVPVRCSRSLHCFIGSSHSTVMRPEVREADAVCIFRKQDQGMQSGQSTGGKRSGGKASRYSAITLPNPATAKRSAVGPPLRLQESASLATARPVPRQRPVCKAGSHPCYPERSDALPPRQTPCPREGAPERAVLPLQCSTGTLQGALPSRRTRGDEGTAAPRCRKTTRRRARCSTTPTPSIRPAGRGGVPGGAAKHRGAAGSNASAGTPGTAAGRAAAPPQRRPGSQGKHRSGRAEALRPASSALRTGGGRPQHPMRRRGAGEGAPPPRSGGGEVAPVTGDPAPTCRRAARRAPVLPPPSHTCRSASPLAHRTTLGPASPRTCIAIGCSQQLPVAIGQFERATAGTRRPRARDDGGKGHAGTCRRAAGRGHRGHGVRPGRRLACPCPSAPHRHAL